MVSGGSWDVISVPISSPGRYSVTKKVRTDAFVLQAAIEGYGQSSGTGTYYFDNAQFEIGNAATPYFDGYSGSSTIYGWYGTPYYVASYKLE